jgi:hypothetical protein
MGEGGDVYRVLVGKPEETRQLGRARPRWDNDIKADPQEVGCGNMDWIELAHDKDICLAIVSAGMNLRVLWNAKNFLVSCKAISFPGRTLLYG